MALTLAAQTCSIHTTKPIAYFGAQVFGSDIDGRQMRGKAGPGKLKFLSAGTGTSFPSPHRSAPWRSQGREAVRCRRPYCGSLHFRRHSKSLALRSIDTHPTCFMSTYSYSTESVRHNCDGSSVCAWSKSYATYTHLSPSLRRWRPGRS